MLLYAEDLITGAQSSWFGAAVWWKWYYLLHYCKQGFCYLEQKLLRGGEEQVICRQRGRKPHDPFVLQHLSRVKQKSPWLWWERRRYSRDSVLQTNDLTPSSLSSGSEQKSAERKAKSDLQSIFIKSQILSLQLYKQYFCELKITSC